MTTGLPAIIQRINNELEQLNQEAIEGLNLARATLARFPNNVVLIQMFAFLNNVVFFVETEKRQIQTISETLKAENFDEIQEAGKGLSA
jgi:ribosomal 50S subunit-associated protein YjgA (DUF615 family)